jgi:hypothetical protein
MTPAPVNGYCTLADLKSPDVLSTPATATDDQFLCDIITSISRSIDQNTGRYFYKSAAHEIRYFTPKNSYQLFVGDLVSVTALYTDDISGSRTYPYTWTATDYDLAPYDAATESEPAPYRWIETTPQGLYQFPMRGYGWPYSGAYNRSNTAGIPKGVKLDGVFGWPEVPSAIAKACLLWSERVFKRYQTPLGQSAMTALGQTVLKIPGPDPDISALMDNYRLVAV